MRSTDPFGWVGSTIEGRFVVQAVAGEGGQGIVYRGEHIGLAAPVAVKCLKLPVTLDDDERADLVRRFQGEAKLLHRLSRETRSIVLAMDAGAATAPNGAWTPYLVMEWLEGETLAAEMESRRRSGAEPRGLGEAIRLLTPVAEALAITHQEGVSHRDVKPANLFLARTRGGSLLKILDFGIAKVLADTPTLSRSLLQTGAGPQAFTPQYGAPEQFDSRYGVTGPWTDVFAMALIVIEVASGRRALPGDSVPQLFVAAADETNRARMLEGVAPRGSPVGAVLRRALAVRPENRYPDLGTLWKALQQAQRSGAEHGNPTTESTPPNAPDEPLGERPPWTVESPDVRARWLPESRVCALMIVGLAASVEPSSRPDPEGMTELFDRGFQAVASEIASLGGVMERVLGERAVAVFGVPRTTDNDTERAITAALAVHAAITRVTPPRGARGARLVARIGIAAGRVVAGVAEGSSKLTLVGDAVGVAERLQQGAPKGSTLVAREAYRRVEGRFNAEPPAPIAGSGPDDSVVACRVTGRIAFRPALTTPDFHGVETKLAGRVTERQRILDALETVVSEKRALRVTLAGAPGIGRSRLLGEILSILATRSERFLVLVGHGSPLAQNTSYSLAAAMLRRRFGIDEADDPAATRRKLRRGMRWFQASSARDRGESPAYEHNLYSNSGGGAARAEMEDTLGQLASLLGPPATATDSITLDDAGQQAKQRIVAAAARLLHVAARRMPVVILCDDLHWADDASLDLFEGLLARGEELPLLVVCSARPELFERRPGAGEAGENHERIDLLPLARRHIEEMIRDHLQRLPSPPPDLVRVLADRAEGVPLTLVETLHLLVDDGVIGATEGDVWAFHAGRMGALALPATVQGIVQARLDRLDPAARSVLACAAVVGRTFWQGAVEDLWCADPNLGSRAEVAPILARLRARQLVRPREPSSLSGERELVFAESATLEVAYEMPGARVRRSLHLRVAEWLAPRTTSRAGAALLASHRDRGGDSRAAALDYARAAAHASSLGENAEAVRHLERVREIHEESAFSDDGAWDGAERRAAPWQERVRLRLELGDALRRAGRLDDAERMGAEARAQILRVERRAGATLDPAEVLRHDARVDFRLALIHKVKGATGDARALVEQAIARATEAGALHETPAMYALLVFLLRRERRPEESWQAARKGLRVCRSQERRDERWQENVSQLLLGVAAALYGRGRMVAAERSFRQVTRIVSAASSPHLMGRALNGVAGARNALGDLDGAREMLLRSLVFKERAGDPHDIAIAYSNLAEVELRLRDVTSALAHARRAVRLGEQILARSDLADMHRNLAEVQLAAGDIDAALDAAAKAFSIAQGPGRVYLGEAALTLARACARGRESASGAPLHERAARVAADLLQSLSSGFEEGDLRRRAEECRALLAR